MKSSLIPIEIENIKHIIYVQDIDRAIHFYHDVLGLHIGLRKRGWCELHQGGSIIGLHDGGTGERTKTGLALQVPDIHAACETIAEFGGIILETPRELDGKGIHYALATDADGNEIMITQVIE